MLCKLQTQVFSWLCKLQTQVFSWLCKLQTQVFSWLYPVPSEFEPCPDDFVTISETCCVKFFPDPVTFYEGEDRCKALGTEPYLSLYLTDIIDTTLEQAAEWVNSWIINYQYIGQAFTGRKCIMFLNGDTQWSTIYRPCPGDWLHLNFICCVKYFPERVTFDEAQVSLSAGETLEQERCKAIGAVPYTSFTLTDIQDITKLDQAKDWVDAWIPNYKYVFQFKRCIKFLNGKVFFRSVTCCSCDVSCRLIYTVFGAIFLPVEEGRQRPLQSDFLRTVSQLSMQHLVLAQILLVLAFVHGAETITGYWTWTYPCDSGWTKVALRTCVFYIPGSFNFDQAEDKCRALGAVPFTSYSWYDTYLLTQHPEAKHWYRAWLVMQKFVFQTHRCIWFKGDCESHL
ncbi:hypothetical protein WMY93_014792 [Mugilogobius chulae]|uniref:C-type lectin domain-containing protein n=1 Tax=Mugilogobius chulae TaxID=88201 RepID=A0AAW0P5H0_9GOBI